MLEQIKIILDDPTLEGNPRIYLEGGTEYICPDFYSKHKKIIGEIHAHLGRLKGSQPDKIASDILKMLLHDKKNGQVWEKYIVVCCKDEYEQLSGNSFLAEAIRELNVKLLLIDLPVKLHNELSESMKKQNLLIDIQ